MKNILLIQAHPDPESYCKALGESYIYGAASGEAVFEVINIRELEFNPNLEFGYRKRTNLEPDLLEAWNKIKWADHIVFIHPLWWGGIPAMAKGFFDRLFLPGMAFQKVEGSMVKWDKLLKGKSARIIITMDQPTWYYRFYYFAPSIRAVKNMTFKFTGIESVRVTAIGPVRLSTEKFRKKWLNKVYDLGKNLK